METIEEPGTIRHAPNLDTSFIFGRLVEKKGDIPGYIAYAIYKFEKIEHIKTFTEENGREPNHDEILQFRKLCCNKERIELYRKHGEQIFHDFITSLLEEVGSDIENDYRKNQDENLLRVIKSSRPKTSKIYAHGICQNLIASFILAIIAVTALILRLGPKGFLALFW